MTEASPAAPLRIVFLGTPEAAVPTLRAVAAAPAAEVVLVTTRPDRPRGRGRGTEPCPVRRAAEELGIPTFAPENVNDQAAVARIAETRPDVLLVVAYGAILKKPLIGLPRLLPMNLHFSLLPEYRGAAPVARAIQAGRTVTGVTLQRLVRRLDAGPVLAAREVEIDHDETAGALEARLAGIGAALVVAKLPAIAAGAVAEIPQDEAKATLAPMLDKAEGAIDWTRPAAVLAAHVRAMNPWPGAMTNFISSRTDRETPTTILAARSRAGDAGGAAPGTIVAVEPDALVAATGDGLLLVRALKPAGRKELSAREFANGFHVAPGDRFVHSPSPPVIRS